MKQIQVTIVNKLGLHARPSAALTQTATRFKSEVWLTKGTRRVNGKSIMGVMMLAAACGAQLTVEANGPDVRFDRKQQDIPVMKIGCVNDPLPDFDGEEISLFS